MKTILVLPVLVLITITPYCYSATDDKNDLETENLIDHVEKLTAVGDDPQHRGAHMNEVDSHDGIPGSMEEEKGSQVLLENKKPAQAEQGHSSGGALYTRFGKTACPNTEGTELVYKGLVIASPWNYYGGGGNYLCLTDNITYLTTKVPSSFGIVYGAEYQNPIDTSIVNRIVPCAVCHTSQRIAKLMIPGTASCPPSWTEEYSGYLMTAHHSHEHNNDFECIDKDAEPATGVTINTNGAYFYHVGAVCNGGLRCPPVVSKRLLTCVVCTK